MAITACIRYRVRKSREQKIERYSALYTGHMHGLTISKENSNLYIFIIGMKHLKIMTITSCNAVPLYLCKQKKNYQRGTAVSTHACSLNLLSYYIE